MVQGLVLCLAYLATERCIAVSAEQRGLSLLLVSNCSELWRILRACVRLAVRVQEALLTIRMVGLAILGVLQSYLGKMEQESEVQEV